MRCLKHHISCVTFPISAPARRRVRSPEAHHRSCVPFGPPGPEHHTFCPVKYWEASLLGTGGLAPRMSPSEIITLLLTVQVSNISRASITASPSRWLLSRHAVLRALRRPAEKCFRAAGGLPAQPPGDQDRSLLHRLHRPCDNHRLNRHLPVWPSAARVLRLQAAPRLQH